MAPFKTPKDTLQNKIEETYQAKKNAFNPSFYLRRFY